MKKGFAILMTLVLCLGMAQMAMAYTPPPADTEGKLTLWLHDEDWGEAVVEAFGLLYPNVEIEFLHIAHTDQRHKATLDGPAGVGPDVFVLPHDHVANAILDGLVEPILPELQAKYEDAIIAPAVGTVMVDGEMYGLPISTENIALFWNKDLFGDVPPAAMEEIKAFAETYNDPAENKWAIAWQVDDAYHNYPFLSAFGMSVFGPNNDDFRNPGFDSPEALKGVEYHMSMRPYFDVDVADAQWDNTVGRFQKGEIPFTITGPWAIAEARNNGVNFGVTKLPTMDGNQPWCFSGNIIAHVSSYTEEWDLAYALLDFLASEAGAAVMYDVTGKLPTLKDLTGIPGIADDPYLSGIAEQSPYSVPMPVIPEVNQMWNGLKNLFSFTWDGTLTPEEAQAKAMETYITELAAAGKSIDD